MSFPDAETSRWRYDNNCTFSFPYLWFGYNNDICRRMSLVSDEFYHRHQPCRDWKHGSQTVHMGKLLGICPVFLPKTLTAQLSR
jgi:hypothetical protein